MLGNQLYRTETAPRYYLGHSFALGYLIANLAVTSALWWVLKRENKRKEGNTLANDYQGPWIGDEDPRWRFHV